MRYQVLDLAFSPSRNGIDSEQLQRLIHGHEVLRATEHFYLHEGVPHLVVCVLYRLAACGTPAGNGSRNHEGRKEKPRRAGEKREEWQDVLQDGKYPLFEALRAWRTARARDDATAPYILFTNVQLAHICNRLPSSKAELADVPGIGKSRLENYGDDVLAVLAKGVPSQRANSSEAKTESESVAGDDQPRSESSPEKTPEAGA